MKKNSIKKLIILVLVIIMFGSVTINVNGLVKQSKSVNVSTYTNKNDVNSDDGIDIDSVGIGNFEDIHYIDNSNYFKSNPKHFYDPSSDNEDNILGTCTTVAMQMLLGYHNFYTDRRLIPYADEEGNRFLENNYAEIMGHPDFLYGSTSGAGNTSTGTTNYVYEKLIKFNNISGIPFLGQAVGSVVNAAERFIDEYASEITDEVVIHGADYREEVIKNQLDDNNPVALGFMFLKGGVDSFHVVVAYGYATYNNEFGYIVHYGWGNQNIHVWVPARWMGYQITMHFDHEHNFVDKKHTFMNAYRELECTECGANTYDYLFEMDSTGNTITAVKYELIGGFILMEKIYGNDITSIATGAFKNCSELTYINLSTKLISIGASAFEGCSKLKEITIPSSVNSIGDNAFKNCSSLSTVTVKRNEDIVTLGANAFLGCSNLDTINVPQNKVLKYKNADNWVNYKNKILFEDNYKEYYFDCANPLADESFKLENKLDTIIKINVGCAKSYKLIFTSDVMIDIDVYNSYYLDEKPTVIYKDNHKTVEINIYLSKGTHYLDIFMIFDPNLDTSAQPKTGVVNVQSSLVYPISSYPVNLGSNNVIMHLHKNDETNYYKNLLEFDDIDHGFYILKLIVTDINGIVDAPSGAITIYQDENKNEIWQQFSMLNNGVPAINNNEQLIVYLNYFSGPAYIEIILDSNNYLSVELLIEKVDESIFDLYNINELSSIDIIEMSNNEYNEHIEKVTLNQIGKFSANFIGFTSGNFIVIEEINISDNEKDYIVLWNTSIEEINEEVILDKGIYYIGYINSQLEDFNQFKITRSICSSSNIEIYQNGGTEVTINSGNNNANTITQGFTRLMYLSNGESRLDYNWYTNNENISRITESGTLMALNVDADTQIKIIAINKQTPSIVLEKDFIIKKETNPENVSILIVEQPIIFNLNSDETVQIDISTVESPINWLQYYTWTCENSKIKIDQFGRITVLENAIEGDYIITGQYKLNSRFTIQIQIKII